jgi:hypothetical protein
MILGIFGDIGKFGDIRTETCLANNRVIALVFFGDFHKFGDIGPSV